MAQQNTKTDYERCLMCGAPARYYYPGPMCASCHRDWAE